MRALRSFVLFNSDFNISASFLRKCLFHPGREAQSVRLAGLSVLSRLVKFVFIEQLDLSQPTEVRLMLV